MKARATRSESERRRWLRRLYLPTYAVKEASRYANTSPRTVSYWYYHEGNLGPALPGRERRTALSYLQLVEMAFVATFRGLGVPLQRIRKAREYAAQVLQAEFPFAQETWLTEGKHLLLDLKELREGTEYGRLVIADAAGQIGWQHLVGERFAQFDYEDGLALKWHVAGRTSPVLIDPRVAFGAPTVGGVPTWAIKGRHAAGESLDDIQADFGLDKDEIRKALEFEGLQLAEAA